MEKIENKLPNSPYVMKLESRTSAEELADIKFAVFKKMLNSGEIEQIMFERLVKNSTII